MADLQNWSSTRVRVNLNGSKMGVGGVFTGTAQDFDFYHGPGLGRNRILLWEWDGTRMKIHPRVTL